MFEIVWTLLGALIRRLAPAVSWRVCEWGGIRPRLTGRSVPGRESTRLRDVAGFQG